MSNNENFRKDGYRPNDQDYGYQPKSHPLKDGFKPTKQVSQPAPPPKKP